MKWLLPILLSFASTAAADHNWEHRDIVAGQTARAKAGDVMDAKRRGLKPKEIAKLTDMSLASVYRIFADA